MDLRIERLDLGAVSCAVLIEVGRVRRIGLSQSGSDVVDIGDGIAEALPAVRVESAMVMVVVACLGMLLVIVVFIMIVRRCLGMLLVIVVVIMPGLGMLIVVVDIVRGLFMLAWIIVILFVVIVRARRRTRST